MNVDSGLLDILAVEVNLSISINLESTFTASGTGCLSCQWHTHMQVAQSSLKNLDSSQSLPALPFPYVTLRPAPE